MLGTRTKQVFAYGRRGHRIVNVTDEPQSESLPEPPAFPKRSTTKSRYTDATKSSPYVEPERAPTPSTSSSEYSPKKLRKKAPAKRAKQAPSYNPKLLSPTRQPLSAVSSNLPSPQSQSVATIKKRKTSSRFPKASPLRALKSSSPVVEVDIVVLDDRGRKVSQERRVSRTDVQANPVGRASGKRVQKAAVAGTAVHRAIVLSSDDESPAAKPPLKHRITRPIIISSDDESDDEPTPKGRLPKLQLPSKSPLPEPVVRPNRGPFIVARDAGVLPSSPEIDAASARSVAVVRPQPSRKLKSKLAPAVVVPPPPRPRPGPKRISQVVPSASLLSPPPPQYQARQLTPMRYRGNRSMFAVPPSPSTDTESDLDDLSFDLDQLALSPNTLKQVHGGLAAHEQPPPQYLVPLLEECAQTTPHEFSAFIEMFPFDPMVQTSHGGVGIVASRESKDPITFQKIGEASYSEVFGIGDVVLKVIPLRDEDGAKPAFDELDSPSPSDAKDVLKEIIVTRAMGEMGSGFVELLRTYIVRGRYPSLLLDLWDEYHERKGSESIRPDNFTVSQVYAIIVLPNGGPDLEAFTFPTALKTGWRQACSLFWQVTRTLAVAEDLVHFEHRDLHWGQILVKSADCSTKPRLSKHRKVPMDHDIHGVRATVIDLGLSRMESDEDSGESVRWTPFDDEVFEGEGDYQFDVYRMMKTHIGNSWEAYCPLTNVMWLHYLLDKLLNAKRLRVPPVLRKNAAPTSTFTERECYECLIEMEGVLRDAVTSCTSVAGKKGRRKTQAAPKRGIDDGVKTADEVLNFGVKRGWVLAD